MLRLVLLRFLESYFRYRWFYPAPIMVMIVAAGVSVMLAKPSYGARGTIYTQSQSLLASLVPSRDVGSMWITPAQAAVNEFNELLQTDAFVRTVVKQTDLEQEMTDDPAQQALIFSTVRGAVTVQTLGEKLLTVGAHDQQPERAFALSKSMIESYLQWKINSELKESDAAQIFFSALIKTYQANVDTARKNLQDYLLKHPQPLRGDRPATEELEISVLKGVVDQAELRLRSALDKEEDVRLNQAKAEGDVRQKYVVVDAPVLPDKSENSRSSQITGALIYVVVGVILTIVGIAGGALIDRSLRFTLDVRNRLELPVLASVPVMRARGKGAKGKAQTAGAAAQPKKATA